MDPGSALPTGRDHPRSIDRRASYPFADGGVPWVWKLSIVFSPQA
jgi:hypothetical protein